MGKRAKRTSVTMFVVVETSRWEGETSVKKSFPCSKELAERELAEKQRWLYGDDTVELEEVEVKVGDGATYFGYSDAHAYTIESFSPSGKKVTLRRDKAKLLNGADSGEPDALKCYPGGFAAHFEGVQRWEYEPDPNGVLLTATLRKGGQWKATGHGTRSAGGNVALGRRSEHYDFNF